MSRPNARRLSGDALAHAFAAGWQAACAEHGYDDAALPDDGTCLTLPDCAERMAVSLRHVENLVRRGHLPSVRIGHAVRIRLVDLLAYQRAQLVARRPAAVPA